MTEPAGNDVITEAVALIDRSLADIKHRELISSTEVADLLLDLRLLLSMPSVDLVGSLEDDDSVAFAASN